MIAQLYSCPCICAWVAFNEGWGAVRRGKRGGVFKKLDHTRIIDHASGWHDQKIGKLQACTSTSARIILSLTSFTEPSRSRSSAATPSVPGHTWGEKRFGYKGFRDSALLARLSASSMKRRSSPAKEQGLCACVYTQLSDVEDELNGFVTYDRKTVKLPKSLVREISFAASQIRPTETHKEAVL